jgi:16S rRNA (cytosine967-C5)-methyltransferase
MLELNREAHACIRVNTLKISSEDLIKKLRESGIEVKLLEGMENVLRLPDKRNLFGTDEFQNGYFEFQDPGSVEVGKFCQVQPGMKVVDVCAGAGGKALQLAAEMKNKGIIVCTDIQDSKLRELRKRSARAGVNNIRIEHAVSEPDKIKAFTKKYRSYADVLLIDAPCSGSGVIKRNPDAKWRITEDFLNFTRSTQQHILHTYAEIVKPGGYLVYATCSIFPSENEQQIKQFLENNNSFVFVEEKMLYPSVNNDGFYMCKLERK